jgi:hypothetical protein
MEAITLQAIQTRKCQNENCLTQLKEDYECYVYDSEEYCSFRCVKKLF